MQTHTYKDRVPKLMFIESFLIDLSQIIVPYNLFY